MSSLCINSYLYIIIFPSFPSWFLSVSFHWLSSPSVSGKCDLFLCWTCFCCHDVHQPPELPLVARRDRTVIYGHISGASVSDVEQGGAATDLWSPKPRGYCLAVPEQSQAASKDPQVWQGATGAQHWSVWPLNPNFHVDIPKPAFKSHKGPDKI